MLPAAVPQAALTRIIAHRSLPLDGQSGLLTSDNCSCFVYSYCSLLHLVRSMSGKSHVSVLVHLAEESLNSSQPSRSKLSLQQHTTSKGELSDLPLFLSSIPILPIMSFLFRLQRLAANGTAASRSLLLPRMAAPAVATKLPLPRFASTKIDPMTGERAPSPLQALDASQLQITKIEKAGTPPPSEKLIFGHSFSDHMLTIPWNSLTGWGTPKITPYAPLTLDPSSVIFHYAPSLFEGMKAYKDANNQVRLFRPDMNMRRMNTSADRLVLPTFDAGELTTLIKKLVALDSDWVPSAPGHSLYIRPTLIGTQAALGVNQTSDALLFVITSPVGPYYPTGFKPVSLEADPTKVRAWPGGTGQYKLGGNYAPGIKPQMEAATRGYHQNLWLFGDEGYLTEVGTMNLFVVLKGEDGVTELVTPPLNGMILPGVTRDSILALARGHAHGSAKVPGLPDKLRVVEREMTIHEFQALSDKGTVQEVFGAGTAAVVSPVERVGYKGRDIHIPTGPQGAGPMALAMLKEIDLIQRGGKEHPWSVPV